MDETTETKHDVYLLSITDGELTLTRPSTARSTIVGIMAGCMGHVDKAAPMKWSISVQHASMTDAEIAVAKSAFDSQIENFLHGHISTDEAKAGVDEIQMYLAEQTIVDKLSQITGQKIEGIVIDGVPLSEAKPPADLGDLDV